MRLTEALRTKLEQYLAEKWQPPRQCPVCGNRAWSVNDNIHFLSELRAPATALTRMSAIPVIVAICTNCGNSLLFNAVSIGLIDRETGRLTDAR